MSWDISVQELPADAKSVSDVPHDFRPGTLGARDHVIGRIRQVLPQTDFADPSWGMLEGMGYSIEFNMGRDEICDGFMLHVRGGGNAVPAITQLLQHLQLRALDCQTGDFFSPQAAEASFKEWQAYRDRVIGSSRPSTNS